MRLHHFIGILVILLGIGLVSSGQWVFAQTDVPTPAPMANAASSAGQMEVLSPNALTSFTVSNPYCFQPDPALDQCKINFRYIQVNDNQSSSPYLTWLTINILGKNRFTATAFFEGTISYSYNMDLDGFKVPCGLPNAGGAGTLYGNVYSVSIRPLDSSRNPMSTDIANVTCPAFSP